MSSFVIGDIHGCYQTFLSLLEKIDYRLDVDTIWMVGDLVNRGPDSLGIARWATSRMNVDMVLGNHDLFLLACAWGILEPKGNDKLDAFLTAKDCSQLIDWLRQRPLMGKCKDHIIVHGGLLPHWTLDTAWNLAQEVEKYLRGPRAFEFIEGIFNDRLQKVSQVSSDLERATNTVQVFTRLRTCSPNGVPYFGFTGPPDLAPSPCRPWYEFRKNNQEKIVFGHWAALGHRCFQNYESLDSGCGWGKELTALRLDDGMIFQVKNLDFD